MPKTPVGRTGCPCRNRPAGQPQPGGMQVLPATAIPTSERDWQTWGVTDETPWPVYAAARAALSALQKFLWLMAAFAWLLFIATPGANEMGKGLVPSHASTHFAQWAIAIFLVLLLYISLLWARGSRYAETLEEALPRFALAVVTVIPCFSGFYMLLSGTEPNSFNERLGLPSALYLTVTTLTTTGFGDVIPISSTARLLVTAQMVIGALLFLVFLASLFTLPSALTDEIRQLRVHRLQRESSPPRETNERTARRRSLRTESPAPTPD
jgi:Ion channel